MFTDSDAGLTLGQVLAHLWTRKPELHRRACACAQQAGQTLEVFARQAQDELAAQLERDNTARQRSFKRREWEVGPFGIGPTTQGGTSC